MIELAATPSTAWAPLPEILFYEPEGRRGADGGKGKPPAKSANTSPLLESSDHGTSSAFRPFQAEEAHEPSAIQRQVADRLRDLRFLAHEDGIRPSADSLRDMQAFLASIQPKSSPSIFLQDSGNYRLIWRNAQHEQIAIQFMGKDAAQFVIFKKAPNNSVVRVAGSCPLNALHRQIEANRAESLLA